MMTDDHPERILYRLPKFSHEHSQRWVLDLHLEDPFWLPNISVWKPEVLTREADQWLSEQGQYTVTREVMKVGPKWRIQALSIVFLDDRAAFAIRMACPHIRFFARFDDYREYCDYQ